MAETIHILTLLYLRIVMVLSPSRSAQRPDKSNQFQGCPGIQSCDRTFQDMKKLDRSPCPQPNSPRIGQCRNVQRHLEASHQITFLGRIPPNTILGQDPPNTLIGDNPIKYHSWPRFHQILFLARSPTNFILGQDPTKYYSWQRSHQIPFLATIPPNTILGQDQPKHHSWPGFHKYNLWPGSNQIPFLARIQ